LTVENVAEAVKLNPYAVDVASSIEQFVGKKDHTAMEMFIKKAKGVA